MTHLKKLKVGLLIVLTFTIIIIFGQPIFFAVTVITGEKITIEHTWELNQNFVVRLERSSSWAGPENFRYILSSGDNQVGVSYSGTSLTDDEGCVIQFKPDDGFGTKINYIWDKCLGTIEDVNR